MKKYFIALALILSVGANSFEVSGDHFKGKFKIDSMTVGENEVTVNASSAAADTGQYWKSLCFLYFHSKPIYTWFRNLEGARKRHEPRWKSASRHFDGSMEKRRQCFSYEIC